MKKKLFKLSIFASLLISAGVLIISCKKTDTTTPTTDTSTASASDNNTAETQSTSLVSIGSQAIDNGSMQTMRTSAVNSFTALSGSVTITPTDTVNRIITVLFNNFVGLDGHLRNGTVVFNYAGSAPHASWYRDSGLVLNVTTPGNTYTVDGNTIEVNTKTIKNLGRITSGNLTWNDNTNITIIKAAGAGTIQWQCNRNTVLLNTGSYQFTADDGTSNTTTYPGVFHGYGGGPLNYINWAQAIVSFSGTFGGTASDGEVYTGSVSSSPLILNFNCTPPYTRYLYVSGILTFTPTGKLTRTINYGNGVCDLTFNVAIGSYNVNITL